MTKHLSRHVRQAEVNFAVILRVIATIAVLTGPLVMPVLNLTFGSALIILIATLGYRAAFDIDKHFSEIRIHSQYNQNNTHRDPIIQACGPCPDYQTVDFHK